MNAKTVFVVFNCAGSFNEFAGVFSSQKLAEKFIDKSGGKEFMVIETVQIDSLDGNLSQFCLSGSVMTEAIEAKALSADAIRCLAYSLASRNGVRSDSVATAIGSRLRNGVVDADEAEWLVSQFGNINLSVWDEVESFKNSG